MIEINDIKIKYITFFTSEENGVAKQFNQTIVQMIQSMLIWIELFQFFEMRRYALLIISEIWCQQNKTKKNHRTNCEQTINQTLIIWKNLNVWFMFIYQQRNEINLISFHFRKFLWTIIWTFKWKFLIRWRKKFNDIQL